MSWNEIRERAHREAEPLNPERVALELNPRLPDRAILTADSGSSTIWWARNVKVRERMLTSVSGGLASMGSAVPYAIAAKLAHPDRPVIAFLGDGAFQMNGMNELITAAKYREEWVDPRLVFAVFVNHDLNMVTWEQRTLAGDPMNPDTQLLPYVPVAEYAKLLGLHAIRCTEPEEIGTAWEEALAADRPVVIEFHVDPEIAPLPPHISDQLRANLASALDNGDPQERGIRAKLEHSLDLS
jgi:pyruvate dehydrogenase (quinone)